jgi:hypothetical protein
MADGKKDRRKFKRYRRKSSCEVSVEGKSYRAETIDYSVDGLGVKVDKGLSIKTGDVLDLNTCYPGMTAGGEVVWFVKDNSATKMGLRRMGMLSGPLREFNLSDVILGLHRSNKTGVLLVVKTPLRKSVYMDKGEMVFAASNDPLDRLGTLLVQQGRPCSRLLRKTWKTS